MEDRQQCTHNCLHGRPLRSCLRLRRRLSLITPDQGVPLHAVHHCRISGPRMATQTARASVTAEALSWPGAWSSQSAPLPFARSQAGVRQSSWHAVYLLGRKAAASEISECAEYHAGRMGRGTARTLQRTYRHAMPTAKPLHVHSSSCQRERPGSVADAPHRHAWSCRVAAVSRVAASRSAFPPDGSCFPPHVCM